MGASIDVWERLSRPAHRCRCSSRRVPPPHQRNTERARCDEGAVAEDEFVRGGVIFVEMNLDDFRDHIALSRVYAGHVDGDRPSLDPELPMPPHQRGDLR
jgi:hypothetical protein